MLVAAAARGLTIMKSTRLASLTHVAAITCVALPCLGFACAPSMAASITLLGDKISGTYAYPCVSCIYNNFTYSRNPFAVGNSNVETVLTVGSARACTHKSAIVRQSLAAANDVYGLRLKLRRSSSAVATSREGHRSNYTVPKAKAC